MLKINIKIFSIYYIMDIYYFGLIGFITIPANFLLVSQILNYNKFAKIMVFLLIFVVLTLFIFTRHAASYSIEISPNQEECFLLPDVKIATACSGSYEVISSNIIPIQVVVTGPSSKTPIYEAKYFGPGALDLKETEGSFSFVAKSSGDYKMCISNGKNSAARDSLTRLVAFNFRALAGAGEQDYEYHKITAWDAVEAGILKQEEIEQAQRDLPDHVFRELYLAEPSDDGSNPFGLNYIKLCLAPIQTDQAVCYGIDLAKSVDYTVIIGLNAMGLICHFERFRMDWGNTTKRIKEVIGKVQAQIDSTGVGDPIVEDLQNSGCNVIGFKYNANSKQELMLGLANALQNGRTSWENGVSCTQHFILATRYDIRELYSECGALFNTYRQIFVFLTLW
jgi:hypothetical protein